MYTYLHFGFQILNEEKSVFNGEVTEKHESCNDWKFETCMKEVFQYIIKTFQAIEGIIFLGKFGLYIFCTDWINNVSYYIIASYT